MGFDEGDLQFEKTMILCSIEESPFGKILIASSKNRICYASFLDDRQESFNGLKYYLIHQEWELVKENIHQEVINDILTQKKSSRHWNVDPIGTEFQKRVWQELLKIPSGETRTYLQVAIEIGSASSARAVGTAIGANPIAWLIPCHRVIQTSGGMGGYRWGIDRKKELLQWEQSLLPHTRKQFIQTRLFPDKA